MNTVITLDDIKAYAEIDYIINHMNEKYINKVPEKIRIFFSKFKDPTYEVKINPYVPLENQGLQTYTLEIIALLHLRYWCEDEKRKQELYEMMIENEEKLESHIKEKIDIDEIFDENFTVKEENEEEEDYSRPRVIQKYDIYAKNNEDIKDYTDYEENEGISDTDDITHDDSDENIAEENTAKNDVEDNDAEDDEDTALLESKTEKVGFFAQIKEKIMSLFKKKAN